MWRFRSSSLAFAKAERGRRADEVIRHVGLAGFEERYPNELSGGMRKRACLARMLLYGAETALLDEPFAALDAQLKLAMHDLMLRLVEREQADRRARHPRPDGGRHAGGPGAGLHAPARDHRDGAAHRRSRGRATS